MAAGPVTERNQDATIYVGGLDDRVAESTLWELFLQSGPVVNVHMPKDRISQSHQGYGFIEFLCEDDADYAIKIMNMIKLYGKPIRVNKASAHQKTMDVGANIFIGNLDPEVDEKLLYDTFSAFGVILQTPKIMRDPDSGNSKGFAFINYASFDAADVAIESMSGQYLCNRAILISFAFKKDSKGERHGSAAERLLAVQNPLSQADRPHQLFADAPSALGASKPPQPPSDFPPPPAPPSFPNMPPPPSAMSRMPAPPGLFHPPPPGMIIPPPPNSFVMPPPPGSMPPPPRSMPPPPGSMPPPPGSMLHNAVSMQHPGSIPQPPKSMPPPPGSMPPLHGSHPSQSPSSLSSIPTPPSGGMPPPPGSMPPIPGSLPPPRPGILPPPPGSMPLPPHGSMPRPLGSMPLPPGTMPPPPKHMQAGGPMSMIPPGGPMQRHPMNMQRPAMGMRPPLGSMQSPIRIGMPPLPRPDHPPGLHGHQGPDHMHGQHVPHRMMFPPGQNFPPRPPSEFNPPPPPM